MTSADARRLIGRLGVSKQRSRSDSVLQPSTRIPRGIVHHIVLSKTAVLARHPLSARPP